MQHEYKTGSFRKKIFFESILSHELIGCRHKIKARYEWKRNDRILTVKSVKNDLIEVGINLNTGRHKGSNVFIDRPELNLSYRAYYISTYIRCLDDAAKSTFQSYFTGLVLLSTINILCSKRSVGAYSPIERKPYEMRPIDVYCAIRALTRLLIDSGDEITETQREGLQDTINELITYTLLPEINYKRAMPTYSLLQEIRILRENMLTNRCSVENYVLFDEFDIQGFEKKSLQDFAMMCEKKQCVFWGNVAIRLSAYFGERIVIDKSEMPFITNCVQRLDEDLVKYYLDIKGTESLFLLDNYMAIKKLSLKNEYVFSEVTANSGMLHYYQ